MIIICYNMMYKTQKERMRYEKWVIQQLRNYKRRIMTNMG